MASAITDTYLLVKALDESGADLAAAWETVPDDQLTLTDEWLVPRGGRAPIVGGDWAVEMVLAYYNSTTKLEEGRDLTGLTITATIFDPLSLAVITDRVTDALIIGAKDDVLEIEHAASQDTLRSAGGGAGQFTMRIDRSETTLTPGQHRIMAVVAPTAGGSTQLVFTGAITLGRPVPS